jgi:predicted TPR repeat methyltransferase
MNAPAADPLREALAAIDAQARAGDLARASATLAQARSLAPGDARVYLAEAVLARAAGDASGEVAALRRAVALMPRSPAVHVELGKALAREGRLDEAVATAGRAVELAPNDPAALQAGVAMANRAGAYALAERHLRAAHALWPADAAITRALALSLFNQQRFGEAEPLYRAVSDILADDPGAVVNLGVCLNELGRNVEAIACFERALALAPADAMAQFHLAIARGETPPTQPNALTEKLFDGYSARFDQHLVGQLKYRVPRRVAEIVRQRHPDGRLDLLDLGCGTGLTGVYLGKVDGALVGVDLSGGMLEQARRHGIYTHLRQRDLREELAESAAESYDCVVANDVFIYVGDLGAVIPAAARVLRRGGALIFSCETAADEEGGFVLRPSKRYAHSRAYVERLCRDAGCSRVTFEALDLRQENQTAIAGFIAVAERG